MGYEHFVEQSALLTKTEQSHGKEACLLFAMTAAVVKLAHQCAFPDHERLHLVPLIRAGGC